VIITRQRKRRRHVGRIVVPLLIVAVVGFLIGFPPTQRLIANGPLRPAWLAGASVVAVVTRPLSFAGQQAVIADRNREIRALNARLDAQRAAKDDADARATALQQQLAAAQEAPVEAPPAAPLVHARPRSDGAAFRTAADGGAGDNRLASTWAAMDPDKAAALVQRLPQDEVVRVLARMDADSAAAILSALPPGVAARISRAEAQVASASDR